MRSEKSANGWTETVLHNFASGAGDGEYPNPLVFDESGNLYGTSYSGVYPCDEGTAFELSPNGVSGWIESQLGCFPGTGDNAAYLSAPVIFDPSGNIYSTSYLGGNGAGTVFELSPSGGSWKETVIYGFARDQEIYPWAPLVRAQRTVAAPFGDVGLPAVDPADIAAAAAVVLRGRAHAGRTYELTGPAPVSPRQQAAAIGAALGEPVRFSELTPAEARARMLAFMPEPVADATLAILGDPSPAEQRVSPDLAVLLGRPPGTFEDWAARSVAAFR